MNLLFVQAFLEGDYRTVKLRILIICVMWGAVGIAMIVDLFSGYRKAKQRKEARTSYGLRRTVDKAVRYYSLMIIAFLFDCIITFFFNYPIATFIFAGFLFIIELKSIWEKAHEKTKKNELETMKEILLFLDNRDDIRQLLLSKLNESNNKNTEGNSGVNQEPEC